ncbi:MAG: xanthine dehydrogenase family protein molybdopterin-binding subunit [Dehalococcoidales bacterium]|nr:xanthine dehydrogenase family protein molybdopterin-binding subunit [Dehalococcoidales bacterium]
MNKGFKPRVVRKYIGTYRPKIEGREKASGKTSYIDDITLRSRFPGMLYAKVLVSPHAHATIKSFDISKAEKMPGVKAVLTYKDPEVASMKAFCHAWTDGANLASYDSMWFPHTKDKRVLSDHVCWVGDEAGIVVAAESEAIAEQALRSIEVEWEVLPHVLDPRESMKPDAPIIHPEINPDGNVLPWDSHAGPHIESNVPTTFGGEEVEDRGPHILAKRGDVEKAFMEAEVIVENTSHYNAPTQNALDAWCCCLAWEGDKLVLWSNSYEANQTKLFLSDMFEMPLNKIRCVSPYVGGSHGRSDTGEQPFYLYTALLAKKTGRPVKFKHTRRESFHDARTEEYAYCKVGARKDGTITGMYIKLIGNTGAYAGHSQSSLQLIPCEAAEVMLEPIPSIKLESYGVYTNRIPASCMRGIGNVQLNFILCLGIDAIAEKLDMDPIDVMLKNFGWAKAVPDKGIEGLLREGARRIGWERRHKAGAGPVYDGTKKRGMGFSLHNSWHTAWQELRRGPMQVVIRVNPDGTVYLEAPTVETGPGSNSCCAFACADVLGVPVEDVKWVSTVDTDICVNDQVQTDSAVSHILPERIYNAALDARRQLLDLAAPKLGVKPDELDIDEGRIFVKAAPQKGMTIKELLWKGDMVPVLSAVSMPLPSEMAGVPYMAAFTEVEVDTETGELGIIKLVILNDCGTVMYASGCEGQQIGGQSFGLGEALMEEMIYDEATGVPLNFNWIDYKFPCMADFGDIEPVPMEIWKGAGEYGACGIGESVLCATPRAVANAVYNAIGVRVDDLPLTPDKILKALGKV